MKKLFYVIMWNTVQYQSLERSFCIGLYFSGANIPDTRSPGWLNFVWWCDVLVLWLCKVGLSSCHLTDMYNFEFPIGFGKTGAPLAYFTATYLC